MQRHVLSNDLAAGVRLGDAMIQDADLVDMALSISAAGGAIADAVKKAIFHGHGVDWPQLLTLAEVVRINAQTLALTAEQQIEQHARQQV